MVGYRDHIRFSALVHQHGLVRIGAGEGEVDRCAVVEPGAEGVAGHRQLFGLGMKQDATPWVIGIDQDGRRDVEVHAVRVVHGHAPALAFDHAVIARAPWTIDRFKEQVEHASRRGVERQDELGDDVDIVAVTALARGDGGPDGHRALWIEDADFVVQRAFRPLHMRADGFVALHGKLVLAGRQLNADRRAGEEDLSDRCARPQGLESHVIHGGFPPRGVGATELGANGR